MSYEKKLDANEWGNIWNIKQYSKTLIETIQKKQFSVQTREMLKIISHDKKIKTMEIGAGSGQTSLCLALAGCDVTVLDFSEDVLELVRYGADYFGCDVNTVCHNAETNLPFQDGEFDIIFHAGLLEHYEKDERVNLLKLWKPNCKTMVSMIPNAASFCYAAGKERQERDGSWQWGRELPDYTQIREFMLAGYDIQREYTAGELTALDFLANDDPMKKLMRDFWADRKNENLTGNFHQGYLLITIGINPEIL